MTKIAILGFGTVGSGVAEVLLKNKESIAHKAGDEIAVKYILERREINGADYCEQVVSDFDIIVNDPEVKVVVEVIGGATVAYEFTKRSLLAGKHVVTSNKELVATHGTELLKIAKEKNINYLFEASVGGGIPIIRPLNQCLSANEIESIAGILNGTTNYILTQMIQEQVSFEDALKDAQEKGYAERDPAADIEGHDVCRKICILASLAFGKHVNPDKIPTEGIPNIKLEDVGYLAKCGRVIKLLGRVKRLPNDRIFIMVSPCVISKENQLANVDGVFNGILINGNAIGDVMFYGRGAGKLPTASAVVADIIDAVKHQQRRLWFFWDEGSDDRIVDYKEMPTSYYVRLRCPDKAAALAAADKAFGRCEEVPAGEGEAAFIIPEDVEKRLDGKLDAYVKEISGELISKLRVME